MVSGRRCDVRSDEHHEVSHRTGAKCFQPDISQELALMFIYWPRESVVASVRVVLEALMYNVCDVLNQGSPTQKVRRLQEFSESAAAYF